MRSLDFDFDFRPAPAVAQGLVGSPGVMWSFDPAWDALAGYGEPPMPTVRETLAWARRDLEVGLPADVPAVLS